MYTRLSACAPNGSAAARASSLCPSPRPGIAPGCSLRLAGLCERIAAYCGNDSPGVHSPLYQDLYRIHPDLADLVIFGLLRCAVLPVGSHGTPPAWGRQAACSVGIAQQVVLIPLFASQDGARGAPIRGRGPRPPLRPMHGQGCHVDQAAGDAAGI